MQDRHVFINHRMSLDDDSRLLKENETREVWNMRSGNTSTNGKGCLETLKSNLEISTLDINIGYTGIPATVYYNTSQSQSFIRNNCGSGYSGSTVTYIVAANTYYSTISQADANNQALADITGNGQNYANSTGTCTLIVVPGGILNWSYEQSMSTVSTFTLKINGAVIYLGAMSDSGVYVIQSGDVISASIYHHLGAPTDNAIETISRVSDSFVLDTDSKTGGTYTARVTYTYDPTDGDINLTAQDLSII